MGQELVLKSKKYLDKNNIVKIQANYKKSDNIFEIQLAVISLIPPAIVALIMADPMMLCWSALSLPVAFLASMNTSLKLKRRGSVLKSKIMKLCRKLDIELSAKDLEMLKENTIKYIGFERTLEDDHYEIEVDAKQDTGNQDIKVSRLQDDLLAKIVDDAITMKGDTPLTEVDESKIVDFGNDTPLGQAIPKQVRELNKHLLQDSDSSIYKSTVRLEMHYPPASRAYANLKNLYKNDLETRINERKNA